VLYNVSSSYCHILQVRTVKGDCLERWTTDENVRTEIHRPVTAPGDLNYIPSRKSSKSALSAKEEETIRSHNKEAMKWLPTISEGYETRGNSSGTEGRGTRGHSSGTEGRAKSGVSLGDDASSVRTYSFHDFTIYDDFDRKAQQEKIEKHKKVGEELKDESSGLTGPRIVITAPTPGRETKHETGFRSSHTSNQQTPVMRETLQQKDNKVKKVESFIERRKLSGYFKKKLIETAVKRSAKEHEH